MLFFELLFSYVSLAISFYVFFLNLFSIAYFLICHLPETLKTRKRKKLMHSDSRKQCKILLQL